MSWDTLKQPAVVVKNRETVNYDLLIVPKPSNEEKMKAAGEIIAGLPQEQSKRVDQIIAELRKRNHTTDEEEVWCSLLRELVIIGPPALPAICAELDATNKQFMIGDWPSRCEPSTIRERCRR